MTRPTPTKFGTICIPFQAMDGTQVVIEISRRQWQELDGDVQRCWAIIDREAEVGRTLLDIDRHESVV